LVERIGRRLKDMRGIEWGGSRRLTALIAVVFLVGATALPATAKPNSSRSTKGSATTEEPALAVESSSDALFGYSGPGSLFDVARRIGLVDALGNPLTNLTGDGVTVAMIDTGVVDVPGLRNSNVTIGPDFSFEDIDPDLRGRDTNGHGTHLAGIIAASDEAWARGDRERRSDRLLGIAPDVELLSIKAGSANGAVDVTQVIAAVNWVIELDATKKQDVDVLLLAYSAGGDSLYIYDPLVAAVERAWNAGITVIVSAGNEGQESYQLTSPARAPFVVAVGASELTDDAEADSQFTSRGFFRTVDVHAPGRSIVSLRNPGSFSDAYNAAGRIGDDLVRATGTSQAAAVVAGAAALILEDAPRLTPDQVKAKLLDGAVKFQSKWEWPTRYLAVGGSLAEAKSGEEQTWYPVADRGSLDGVRGASIVEVDGVPLVGQQDIFGVDYSDSNWAVDSWTGHSWSGHSWSSDTWAGHSWSGHSWSADVWSGHSWSGHSWSADVWSGHSWSGHSWSADVWSGHSWSGHSWSGTGWD
jgi:serine protease AprX